MYNADLPPESVSPEVAWLPTKTSHISPSEKYPDSQLFFRDVRRTPERTGARILAWPTNPSVRPSIIGSQQASHICLFTNRKGTRQKSFA